MHRVLVDLTALLSRFQLANVIHEAAFRRRFVEAAVRDAQARVWGRQRLSVLDRAIALHHAGSAGTRSRAEDAFLALAGGFAEPLVNVGFGGFERDFRWPGSRLVAEIDGPGHGRPRSRPDDARRDRALREAGYSVLRFTDADADVYRRPREILAALATRIEG